MRLSLSVPGQRRRFGDILVELKMITREELAAALAEQRVSQSGKRLGTLLMERKLINSVQFMRALAHQLSVVKRFGEDAEPA